MYPINPLVSGTEASQTAPRPAEKIRTLRGVIGKIMKAVPINVCAR